MMRELADFAGWLQRYNIKPGDVEITINFKRNSDRHAAAFALHREFEDMKPVKGTTGYHYQGTIVGMKFDMQAPMDYQPNKETT